MEHLSKDVLNYLILFIDCKKYNLLYLTSKKYNKLFRCYGDYIIPNLISNYFDFYTLSDFGLVKKKRSNIKIKFCYIHDDPDFKEIFCNYRKMIYNGSNSVHFSNPEVRKKAKTIEKLFGNSCYYCCNGKGITYDFQ